MSQLLVFKRVIKILNYDFLFIICHPRSVSCCFMYFDVILSRAYMFVIITFLDIVFVLSVYFHFPLLILYVLNYHFFYIKISILAYLR